MLFDEYSQQNPLHATRGQDDINYGQSGDAVAITATAVLPIIYNAGAGSDGDLLISNTTPLTEVTYEMWVKPQPGTFFEAPGVSAIYDTDITVLAGDNALTYEYQDYERIHLAIRVGVTIDLFVNGLLVDSVEPYFILEQQEGDIIITDSIFDGVAVFDRILHNDSIWQHYLAGSPVDDYNDVVAFIAPSHINTVELIDQERNILYYTKFFEEQEMGTYNFPMELPPEATSAKLTWRGPAYVTVDDVEVLSGVEFDVSESNELTLITNDMVFDLELVVYGDDLITTTGDRTVQATDTAAVGHPPIEQNLSAGTASDVIVGAGSHVGTALWWQYDGQWEIQSLAVNGTGGFTITNPSRVMMLSLFDEVLTVDQINHIEESAYGKQFALLTGDNITLDEGDPLFIQTDWTVIKFG